MANETDTGLMGQRTTAEELIAQAAKPFDPATLLTSRPEALPYRVGPTDDVSPYFDPATLLGTAATRGPAMIGDGRPLVARIGGVEVVTIPVEHYATLLSPLALGRPCIVAGGGKPDAEGMLLFLLSLHAEGAVSLAQLVLATGLDHVDLGDRITAYAVAQPQPWTGEMQGDGTITGRTDKGIPFKMEPMPEPVEVVPAPAPVIVSPTPEEATIDLSLPAGMPEEATIALPAEPLDTRTTPPEPEKSTRHMFRRRDKHEHRGGPMDAKGQPDNRETDVHDTMPHGRRDGLDLA